MNVNFNPSSGQFVPGANSFFGAPGAGLFDSNSAFGSNVAGTSPAFRENMLQLRRTADMLSQSLSFMRGIGRQNASSPFINMSAVPEEEGVLRILQNARASSMASARDDFSVEVLQVAQAQRNEGANLSATALATSAGFTTGSHHIGIHIDGRQFDFNFTVSASDTVRDVQQRIANAVNTRDIGVTASLSQSGGNSRLDFQSTETGVANEGQPNFSLSSRAGNALVVSGINNVAQEAQNAQFRVNRGFTGALRTSRSNEVDLGFGMTAMLQETGTTNIAMERDEVGQINAFRHMVNSFNNLMTSAREASDSTRGNRLERELGAIVRTSSSGLRRLGITMNREGRLQIDEDRMREAAERGDLERFAVRDGGGTSGFINRLARMADNVNRNPESFMRSNSPSDTMPGFNFSPTQFAQLNRIANMGMLFDSHM